MNSVDRTAIENLVFRYARYVDTAQYDALGALFADAKVTTNKTDQVFVGKDAVREAWRMSNKRFAGGTPLTQHVISNLEFEPTNEGTVVRVTSYFTVFQATPKIPLQPIVCGRYDDAFDRGADGWRFRSKHIEITLLGNMSDHLNLDISMKQATGDQ
jgi:3-phenylpropionate/cinnamic acid dioxygenase small subunit